MARIVHPNGTTTIHHDGKLYEPDKKGVFEVPSHIVDVLRPHGFLTVDEAMALAVEAAEASAAGQKGASE